MYSMNKYVYSTTRIVNIWYMEAGLPQAEIVYYVPYKLAHVSQLDHHGVQFRIRYFLLNCFEK